MPVDGFKCIENFIKNYPGDNDEGYFVEVDTQYPENLHNRGNGLLFLPEIIKIEEVEKLVANLHDTREVNRFIKLSQKSWLKS